ncbi:DUF6879 family protein [Nocardia gipuzkoensis]
MRLLQGEAVNELLRTCKHSALHLELRDSYDTPEDSEEFRRFLSGEPDDFAWMEGWAALVGGLVDRGVAVQRARAVTVPHTDWTRWGLEVAAINSRAGEDVRYLPRHLIAADELGAEDWWLLDGERVAFTLFEDSGQWAGAAVTTDPHIVGWCRDVWNRVWDKAVPYADYRVFDRT